MPRRYYERDYDRYSNQGNRGYNQGPYDHRREGRFGRGSSQDRYGNYGNDRGRRTEFGNQGDYGDAYRRDDRRDFGGGMSYYSDTDSNYETGGYYGNESNYGYSGGSSDFRGESESYGRGYRDYDRGYGSDYETGSYGGGDYNQDYDRGGYYGQGRRGAERDYDRGGYYGSRNLGYDRDYDREMYERGQERGFFDRAGDEVASWFGDDEAERRRRRDRRGNRGKGPKGYTRSDERVEEDVNDRLSDDYYLDASNIEVEVEDGEVTLSGNVDSRYGKRHAEDIADSVSGVSHVQNNLRIAENDDESLSLNQTETETSTTGKTTSAASRGKSKSASS